MALSARWRTRPHGARPERGAAAVEFAIVLVVLLLILFGIIDFGRLLFVDQAMKAASREGARAAVIKSPSDTGADTGEKAFNAASNAGATAAALAGGSLSVTYTTSVPATFDLVPPWPVNWSALCTAKGAPVTVTTSTPFTWFTPAAIFASGVNQVRASTTMRCE